MGLGKLLCAIGSHPCRTNSDDHGIWGECIRCHRRFGWVSRARLRFIIEAEAAEKERADPTPTHTGWVESGK